MKTRLEFRLYQMGVSSYWIINFTNESKIELTRISYFVHALAGEPEVPEHVAYRNKNFFWLRKYPMLYK